MVEVKDLKVKLLLDDAEAQEVIAELLRGAAAFEQLLLGLDKAFSSDAGQAVIVDALVRRIEELKRQAGNSWEEANRIAKVALEARRALAFQFEEGDFVELLVAQAGVKAGTLMKVETTPVQRARDGKALWGDSDWVPTTAMCSCTLHVGNIEIPLIDLRLVTKGGAR